MTLIKGSSKLSLIMLELGLCLFLVTSIIAGPVERSVRVYPVNTVELSLTPVPEGLYGLLADVKFPISLSHNSPEQISQEMLDTNILTALGKRFGLSAADINVVRVERQPTDNMVTLVQLSPPDKVFKTLERALKWYGWERQGGHTREFLVAALAVDDRRHKFSDPDLRILTQVRPLLAGGMFLKTDAGEYNLKAGTDLGWSQTISIKDGKYIENEVTNVLKNDEKRIWERFKVSDAGIDWVYELEFGKDNSVQSTSAQRIDSHDLDKSFANTMDKVDSEVNAQIMAEWSKGLVPRGRYEQLKKEKLRGMGIEWHSFDELNPNMGSPVYFPEPPNPTNTQNVPAKSGGAKNKKKGQSKKGQSIVLCYY